jgi:hypothetical protein
MAQLYIVPASNPSWGYGLYVKPDAPADAIKRAAAQFDNLKSAHPLLLKALDLGKSFDFETPPEAQVQAMRNLLAAP